MRLDLIAEQETEIEIRKRLDDMEVAIRTPRNPRVIRFYAKWGRDWLVRFYQNNISISGLPHENNDEIGY